MLPERRQQEREARLVREERVVPPGSKERVERLLWAERTVREGRPGLEHSEQRVWKVPGVLRVSEREVPEARRPERGEEEDCS